MLERVTLKNRGEVWGGVVEESAKMAEDGSLKTLSSIKAVRKLAKTVRIKFSEFWKLTIGLQQSEEHLFNNNSSYHILRFKSDTESHAARAVSFVAS